MTTLASNGTSFESPAKPEPLTHRGGSPPQRSGTPEDFIDYVPHPHGAKSFTFALHRYVLKFFSKAVSPRPHSLLPFFLSVGVPTSCLLLFFSICILSALGLSHAKTMNDYDLLSDLFEVPSTLSFPVIQEFDPLQENRALFLPDEPDRPLTKQEKDWVQEATRNPDNTDLIHNPPSAPALRSLQKQLSGYSGPMPVTKEQWQNYVMKQYFMLSRDPDPKVSKPALDAIAKTNLVGLHTDVQEININTKSTIELEATLAQKLQQIIQKKNVPQDEEAIEAEWSEAE